MTPAQLEGIPQTIFRNMTAEQIRDVQRVAITMDQYYTTMSADYDKLGDVPEHIIVLSCGWNQFCENLGLEGYEFT